MAPAKWEKLRQWRESHSKAIHVLAVGVIVVLNLIQLVVLGWIFWVLVQGTTANSTILSTYTGAVIGIVFLLSSAVIGLTASDRKERERLGITTMTGMFCEAGLIIFGQLAIGSILVMGWFSIFVMYCLLR